MKTQLWIYRKLKSIKSSEMTSVTTSLFKEEPESMDFAVEFYQGAKNQLTPIIL